MKNKTLKHIAIIPDGNRRWAREKGLPTIEGHRFAADKTIPKLYDTVMELGISYCTLWALSPENFTRRTKVEINYLLQLLHFFIHKRIDEMNKKDIKLKIIGDMSKLPKKFQNDLAQAEEKTKDNKSLTLIFGVNYGGRDEMVRAFNKILNSKPKVKNFKAGDFEHFLDTSGIPDPDLIIRTGGEKRTSGFMLWQSEYAEYAFLDKYFPDFTPQDLRSSISDFLSSQRRFGR
ncbi:MAG: di-trans,poly-cis-decaprenylcistransferase [Candidatus Levybacteria bacterium CG10_big_fil_rev_8_21_14_0_10_36_7]|nr:MAG: di-trans,poly-cis-decaprenylcistransferase [Candidatus Levybacteria bacterium CG10_big_fil_rev_8_21_14_0_10_36_7]